MNDKLFHPTTSSSSRLPRVLIASNLFSIFYYRRAYLSVDILHFPSLSSFIYIYHFDAFGLAYLSFGVDLQPITNAIHQFYTLYTPFLFGSLVFSGQ
ncbi:hypothetical protein DFS33DRAFT_964071 [Desarmillaria ectypa]|nr:hypothetical protein DFS33DRAFT_964071 [Desarmillaria ectypa]